jgi:hypothetical protein
MDPGYHSPLIDQFRRGDTPREMKLLAAQGDLAATAHEQLALLVLLADDRDTGIASAANATIKALPVDSLQAFLARADAPAEMTAFFGTLGIAPGPQPSTDASAPLLATSPGDDAEDDPDAEGENAAAAPDDTKEPRILSGLPVKTKMKLAFKGSREQRAQLIRDPNRIVAAAVLSSPKLTDAEVESFAKMGSVSEDVLRVIASNRTWLKNYGVLVGLVKNPKTPPAISMQLLQRIAERDVKTIAFDRNVPESLRLAARKFIVKGLK